MTRPPAIGRVACTADCTVDCGRCKGKPFEYLRDVIVEHHERIKSLGLNNTRDVPQWGGPWDHQLWAAVGLPAGPETLGGNDAR